MVTAFPHGKHWLYHLGCLRRRSQVGLLTRAWGSRLLAAGTALLLFLLPVIFDPRLYDDFTLPKQAVTSVGSPDYFEVTVDDGRLVLTPARLSRTGAIRRKLQELGITETGDDRAVRWARRK